MSQAAPQSAPAATEAPVATEAPAAAAATEGPAFPLKTCRAVVAIMDQLVSNTTNGARTATESWHNDVCIFCGVRPNKFHSTRAEKEYKNISRICPSCWELSFLSRNPDPREKADAVEILKFYGRNLILGKKNGWECQTCQKVSLIYEVHQCTPGVAAAAAK
jgi:hypothetical protein